MCSSEGKLTSFRILKVKIASDVSFGTLEEEHLTSTQGLEGTITDHVKPRETSFLMSE